MLLCEIFRCSILAQVMFTRLRKSRRAPSDPMELWLTLRCTKDGICQFKNNRCITMLFRVVLKRLRCRSDKGNARPKALHALREKSVGADNTLFVPVPTSSVPCKTESGE